MQSQVHDHQAIPLRADDIIGRMCQDFKAHPKIAGGLMPHCVLESLVQHLRCQGHFSFLPRIDLY